MSNKQLTQEELENILKAHDLSFSDIAKALSTISSNNNAKDDEEEKAKVVVINRQKPKFEIKFELAKASYPDFVIRKTTKLQTKELWIIPSKKSFYIRTLKKNGEYEIEKLTPELYENFMSGFKSEEQIIKFPDDFYIQEIKTGKVFGEALLKYFEIKNIPEMLKNKCAPTFQYEQLKSRGYHYVDPKYDVYTQAQIYEKIPIIYKEFYNHESTKIQSLIKENAGMIVFVYKIYGIEKARDFVNHYNLCLYDNCYQGYGYCYKQSYEDEGLYDLYYNYVTKNNQSFYLNIPFINMEYERFKEYLLYQSYRMGYITIQDFLTEWRDTLSMQWQTFGKIREKYPEDLPLYHKKIIRRKAQKIDKDTSEGLEIASKKLVKYEYKPDDGNFVYTIPKTYEDIQNEAEQQGNCLARAGYAQRIIGGTSVIVFMRKKETPERSYITMEIVGDTINQAYLASNVPPTQKDKEEIKKYANHFNLTYNC